MANERKELYRTGGGKPPSPLNRDRTDQLLESIVNDKTLRGVPAFRAPYDDDYIKTSSNEKETTEDSSEMVTESTSVKVRKYTFLIALTLVSECTVLLFLLITSVFKLIYCVLTLLCYL